jgi:hypothetical protein
MIERLDDQYYRERQHRLRTAELVLYSAKERCEDIARAEHLIGETSSAETYKALAQEMMEACAWIYGLTYPTETPSHPRSPDTSSTAASLGPDENPSSSTSAHVRQLRSSGPAEEDSSATSKSS